MKAAYLGVMMAMAGPAVAADCGGAFDPWRARLVDQVVAAGHDRAAVAGFYAPARPDPKVLQADRAQGVFRRPFTDFARRLISPQRLQLARAKAKDHAALLQRAAADYGVAPEMLLAFWAFETDFGAVQGDFNTLNALMTLAHDCRRPDLFRPQAVAAFDLFQAGGMDGRTTGAWAGEIGMVQMLPADILRLGVDGDGDGKVDLKGSVADALLSGAALLRAHGWQAGQPWLQEVVLPADLDWSLTGLDHPRAAAEWHAMGVRARAGQLADLSGAILLPEGRKGPAFVAYPNFKALFEWNKSMVYVTTAAYFATRIGGAAVFDPGAPEAGLAEAEMKLLQQKLTARGHDVGAVDGILGAQTRAAVQVEQHRLGLAADAWPTRALLDQL